MGQSMAAWLNNEQTNAVEDLQEQGRAENDSEALGMLIDEGMREYGYRPNGDNDTRLKAAAAELSRLFGYAGAAWIVFFWAFPIEVRIWGVVLLTMALSMIGAYMVLMSVEPAVSNRLFGRTEEDRV